MNRNSQDRLGTMTRRKKKQCFFNTTRRILRNLRIVVFFVIVIQLLNFTLQLSWLRGATRTTLTTTTTRWRRRDDIQEKYHSSSSAQGTKTSTGSGSILGASSSSSTTSSSRTSFKITRCKSQCLTKFGQKGKWVQDWEFARDHGQYSLPRVIPDGPMALKTHGLFQPSKEAPFPWPTSWKWVDESNPHDDDDDDAISTSTTSTSAGSTTMNSSTHHCQLNVHAKMTNQEKCDLLWNRLNIRRIAFYGDSLTESQYTSFVNLFGKEYIELSPTLTIYNATLVCSTTGGTDAVDVATATTTSSRRIPLFFQRDQGGQAYKHSNRTLYKLDSNLESFIAQEDDNSLGRVLVVFNIGAHYHNFTWYKEDVQVLLQSLEHMQRPQDLYVFRTTSPGHYNCNPTNPREFNWTWGTRDVPLRSIDELDLDGLDARLYNWDLFQYYNAHTKKVVKDWNERQWWNVTSVISYKPIMHVLDVYNMTALRRDGHSATGKDCLHYHLPGPVDWWNHLLFAYLEELSRDLTVQDGVLNCIPP